MSFPYVREAGAALILVALAFSHGCVYRMAGSKARAEQAEQAAAYERQLAHAIRVGNERADKLNAELQAELAKPQAGPIIREVVRANPSHCVVPKPVAASLREAIRSANQAAR